MDGILKRRGAENAEEVLRKELCVLCDSTFLFLQALAELTQLPMRDRYSFASFLQWYVVPIQAQRESFEVAWLVKFTPLLGW